MNLEKEINIVELFKEVWSYRKKLLKWTAIGVATGILIGFSMPDKYSTVVKIASEDKTNAMSGTTGAFASMMGISGGSNTSGVRKELYPEIIKSSPFVMEFAYINVKQDDETMPLWQYLLENQKKPWWSHILSFPSHVIGWASSLFASKDTEVIQFADSQILKDYYISTFSGAIQYEADKKSGVISLTSTFQDAKVSTIVADSMTVKLQQYMTNYRTQKTRASLESNIRMLDEAQAKYYQTEEDYANAADKNQDLISKVASIKLERLKNERDLAFQIYQQIAGQVEMDRVKLQEDIPIATIIEPAKEPFQTSAPNRKLIIVAFGFLFAVGYAGTIVVKYLMREQTATPE